MKMGVKVGVEGDWEIGKWGNGVCGCEDGFGWIDVGYKASFQYLNIASLY